MSTSATKPLTVHVWRLFYLKCYSGRAAVIENGWTLPPFVTDLHMFGQPEFLLLKGWIL